MNKKAFARLEELAGKCDAALKDKARQSMDVWRGDMWAIIGAHHDIKKLRNGKPKRAAIGGTGETP